MPSEMYDIDIGHSQTASDSLSGMKWSENCHPLFIVEANLGESRRILFQGKEVHSLQAIHESSSIKFIRRSSSEY